MPRARRAASEHHVRAPSQLSLDVSLDDLIVEQLTLKCLDIFRFKDKAYGETTEPPRLAAFCDAQHILLWNLS